MPKIKIIDNYFGTVSPSEIDVDVGDTATFELFPSPNCEVVAVYLDSTEIDFDDFTNKVTTPKIMEDCTLYVKFDKINYCGDRIGYNRFNPMPTFTENILNELIKNNDDLWRLLKYNTADALSRPFLSLEEKASMIYKGIGDSANYRVFKAPFLDDAITDSQTQFRIYITEIDPQARNKGIVSVGLECVTHIKITELENNQSRIETMFQSFIDTLNGLDINGIGVLYFDDSNDDYNLYRINIYNNRNYYGSTTIMSCWVGDNGD